MTIHRHLYERAVLTHTYARLLSKWEKRETSGQDMMRDADMLFESVLGDSEGDSGSDSGSGSEGASSSGGDSGSGSGSVLNSLGAMISYPLKL